MTYGKFLFAIGIIASGVERLSRQAHILGEIVRRHPAPSLNP